MTGGGAGIGRVTCVLLTEEWASTVIVADRHREGAEGTAELVADLGARAPVVEADVGVPAGADAIRDLSRSIGRLDLAVNSAALACTRQRPEHYRDLDWDEVMQVNVGGVFRCMRTELELMYAGGGGAVVNVSSARAYRVTREGIAGYATSDSALAGLTRTAAFEAGSFGVRVNAVAPG